MNRLLVHIIIALLLFTTHASARQQAGEDTWARYKSGKLSGVIKSHSDSTGTHEEGVDLGSDPVRARVTYTGKSRPTVATKQRFISFYMESLGTSEFAKKFGTEMLFIEDGVEFWLPVQDILLSYFRKELHKGERVTLFANWIGITYPERGRSGVHVFLVNEFEKQGASKTAPTVDVQWGTLTSPDRDFRIDFPVEPKRDEFRTKRNAGEIGRLTRRYSAYTDTLMLVISFEDLGYAPNSVFADRVGLAYEQKIREVARRDGWKIISIQRLSNSVAEVEAWERSVKPAGYVHTISRTVIRNGQAYDLQCRSMFVEQEVDRAVCRHFFSSFHVIGPPQ